MNYFLYFCAVKHKNYTVLTLDYGTEKHFYKGYHAKTGICGRHIE